MERTIADTDHPVAPTERIVDPPAHPGSGSTAAGDRAARGHRERRLDRPERHDSGSPLGLAPSWRLARW